jgi:hypothetical protein
MTCVFGSPDDFGPGLESALTEAATRIVHLLAREIDQKAILDRADMLARVFVDDIQPATRAKQADVRKRYRVSELIEGVTDEKLDALAREAGWLQKGGPKDTSTD